MRKSPAPERTGADRRGEDARRRLIDVAIEMFASRGYEGATTRMLAEQADVNLPAIPYYFGSKEGLFRAAIDHIVEHFERHMSPVADRVRKALRKAQPRETLLALLFDMLDAFLLLVASEDQPESRRLLIVRAEIERAGALASLHKTMMRQVVAPCTAVVGRLLRRPVDDELIILRTVAILGQVTIFCNKGPQRALGWRQLDAARAETIQTLLHEHTEAIIRAAEGERRAPAKSRRTLATGAALHARLL